jgi:hypothetical protein
MLRHHGITEPTIDGAMVLFSRFDGAAYGSDPTALADGAKRALAVFTAIDEEARGRRVNARSRRGATAALLLVLASTLAAQSVSPPRATFDEGMREYAEGNFGVAAQRFLAAAHGAPRASAAWANFGTASWTAADTARAVVGWQRALRLNPMDDDARNRLTLVGTDAGAGHDVVWPVPRRAPAWLGLLLWLGAWYGIWRAKHQRIAVVLASAAVALVVLSQLHHRRLTDPAIAVVSEPAALRLLPALGAEAGPTPLTGELVRVTERSGVWVRVQLPGARDGWIDGARLRDLDAQSLRQRRN